VTNRLTTAAIASPLLAAILLAIALVARVSAHPMPNTVIAVSADASAAHLTIAVPVPELRLALTGELSRDALIAYFNQHLTISSFSGTRQAHTIEAVEWSESVDPDVGGYQELTLRVRVPAASGFDPRTFTLHYDAIIHQVPNHFAVVQNPNSREDVIAFDFARNGTRAVDISVGTEKPAQSTRGAWSLAGCLVIAAFCLVRSSALATMRLSD